MSRVCVAVILCLVLNELVKCESDELLSVAVLFRHGSRAPRKIHKSDPYITKVAELWPEGLSELTRIGKNQEYLLGRWYRKHFKDFIPIAYDPGFVRVMSSDKDRCLMSAQCVVAGLFPPTNYQIWNANLLWQPIPIHSTPKSKDAIIVNEKPCAKYDKLFAQLLESEYFTSYMDSKKDLFDYLSEHSGEEVRTLDAANYIHDTLFIENYHDKPLPAWTKKVFPHDTLPLVTQKIVLETNNTVLGKLRSGPLIDYITSFLENAVNKLDDSQKLLMLSVHDSTIMRLLNTLEVYDNTWPEYSSTVIFELRRRHNDSLILNLSFKNSTIFKKIRLNGCDMDCPFDQFKKIIEPVRLSEDDLNRECSEV